MVVTLGYVRCHDLRTSFDTSDQLVLVIRAPPETQMQVSDPSEVGALAFHQNTFWGEGNKSHPPIFAFFVQLARATRSR